MDLINGPSGYTALRRRLADPGLFLDSGFRRNDEREGSGEFRGVGGVTWHAYRLGDVLTLKRGHDLPDSQPAGRRRPGRIFLFEEKGLLKFLFLTDAPPGYNTAPTRPTATPYGPAAYPGARPGRSRC